jgi:hypothetical protein
MLDLLLTCLSVIGVINYHNTCRAARKLVEQIRND